MGAIVTAKATTVIALQCCESAGCCFAMPWESASHCILNAVGVHLPDKCAHSRSALALPSNAHSVYMDAAMGAAPCRILATLHHALRIGCGRVFYRRLCEGRAFSLNASRDHQS